MHTYWIILILTLILTPNVPICKFRYQIMFHHYADHHLSDHYAAVKVIMELSSCIILNMKRDPHVKYISHYICHSIVKLLYNGKGKKRKNWKLGTEELRCTSLCTTTMHIELYVCIFLLLVTMNCNADFICTVTLIFVVTLLIIVNEP